MSEDRGAKILELEDLIFGSAKKAVDMIFTNCKWCGDTKFIIKESLAANGDTVYTNEPCPNCNKDKDKK